jgi:two-component system alkaline phosphatase synthesis response regulator PhoP
MPSIDFRFRAYRFKEGWHTMAKAISDTDKKPRRILIADHERSTAVPLQFLMEQNGYKVKSAQSGKEALQTISSFKPDIILLEAMLPDPDGFEVCQTVRQDPDLKGTRIVFVSAMVRDLDMAKGLALGADIYITKPFSNTEILDAVRKLVENG